jgi:RNA polymerase sigma-70 factor (ECF subfamily)
MTDALTLLAAIALVADDRGRDVDRDTDLALVARHRDADPDAFPAIYRAHAAAVYRRLTRILGPIAEREDLTQDVFFAVHRALPRFRGEASLGTLIQRIAINTAYDFLRRRGRRPATAVDPTYVDELVGPQWSPEDAATRREELARVFACLGKIKPKKRIALLLHVVDGLSFAEIAVLVDATTDAVAKRVQHGQRELDALLARASAQTRGPDGGRSGGTR